MKIKGIYSDPLYSIYRGIIRRTTNESCKEYKHYGGRGIVCEWESVYDFIRDMKKGYKTGLSIERKDNDGNYCKKNCKWATKQEQALNTRRTVRVGKKPLKKIAEEMNVSYNSLYSRIIKKGWSLDECIWDFKRLKENREQRQKKKQKLINSCIQ